MTKPTKAFSPSKDSNQPGQPSMLVHGDTLDRVYWVISVFGAHAALLVLVVALFSYGKEGENKGKY